jgi:Golgi phosphoprotein 3 (GPP34)
VLIAREGTPRSVLDWLTVLAADAPTLVAQRLAEDDWLVPEYRRSLWAGRVLKAWVPVNVVEADGARQALRRVARGLDRRPGPHDLLVVGLVDAVQLTRTVIADLPDPAAAAQTLADLAAHLDDSLQLLVEKATTAADNAVMTHTG